VQEGGPRNGVLTAVEDYLSESDLQYRFLNLPLYYGLGILVTEQRLAENPDLAAEIARLEALMQGEELVRLAEHLRLSEGVVLQALNRKLLASEKQVAELEGELAGLKGGPAEADSAAGGDQ
jgi:hypothetical protein